MKKEHPATLCCSFCGKSQREVRKLMTGPRVCVCDECIYRFNEIIARSSPDSEAGRRVEKQGEAGESNTPVRCSFCEGSQREVGPLIGGPGTFICDECIGTCNQIIAEELEPEHVDPAPPALPEPSRSLLAGILDASRPAAEKVLRLFRRQYAEYPASAGAHFRATRAELQLLSAWLGVQKLLREVRRDPGGLSPEAGAEAPSWVLPIAERLSRNRQVLEALAERLDWLGPDELRASLKLASANLREARALLLAGPRGPFVH